MSEVLSGQNRRRGSLRLKIPGELQGDRRKAQVSERVFGLNGESGTGRNLAQSEAATLIQVMPLLCPRTAGSPARELKHKYSTLG